MRLTRQQAVAKMMEPVKRPVSFPYPGREGGRSGILEDRVKYWDVVDLIKFGDSHWMRIGYYRQVGGQLHWASQTTI